VAAKIPAVRNSVSRRYPLFRITATALLFGFTTFSHVYFETPFDQYRTWAEGNRRVLAVGTLVFAVSLPTSAV